MAKATAIARDQAAGYTRRSTRTGLFPANEQGSAWPSGQKHAEQTTFTPDLCDGTYRATVTNILVHGESSRPCRVTAHANQVKESSIIRQKIEGSMAKSAGPSRE
jgi:hypothetical protein